MNDLLAALLLGIIEGITEFLPISSTGHLLIAERWLGHRSDLFNISIQAGAILAVVLIYWQRLVSLTVGFREPRKRDYALKLALAFGVTAVLGILVKKLGFELPETIEPVAWALLLGGFVILGVEAIDARRADLPDDDPDAIGWGTAVLVGFAQVLAGVFPGTSRSAAAIFAALLFGKSSRLAATEFAFLVGIPTMFAATGYELVDMLRDGSAANEDWTALAVAFVASAITAFIAVKWLLRYIQTHRFTIFAWYRIVFGAALLAWLYFGAAAPVAEARAAHKLEARPANENTLPGSTLPQPQEARMRFSQRASAGTAFDRPATAAATRSLPLDPATEALWREFELRKFCTKAIYVRDNLAGQNGKAHKDMLDARNVPAEFRAQFLEDARLTLDMLDLADRQCADLEDELMDGSSYDLALRAAESGNKAAAECFVAGSFPMPPALHKRPEVLARFRFDAARLVERGIAQGDWNMVSLAQLIHFAPPWPAPRFEAPIYEPGLRLTVTIGPPGGNALGAYRMSRLMQLGAPTNEGAHRYAGEAAESGKKLNASQRAAADAWARSAFERQFGRRLLRDEDTLYCD